MEYYLQSLDFARQSGNKLRIETALNNIGVTYFKNPETNNKALDYYLEALQYALQIKDNESTGFIYTNIGEVNVAKKDFDKAAYYYNKAVHTLSNLYSIAFPYIDFGKMYREKRQYDSANLYFEKAYEIAVKNNSLIDILQSLIGKAKLHAQQGDDKNANALFQQALEYGKTQQSTPELKEIYQGLSAAYTKQNDYRNAYIFQSGLVDIFNNENKKKLNFNTATLAYSVELQKQTGEIAMLIRKNELQQSDLETKRFTRNVSISILAIVLIFATILLININQRKKLNRLLSIQNKKIEAQKMAGSIR